MLTGTTKEVPIDWSVKFLVNFTSHVQRIKNVIQLFYGIQVLIFTSHKNQMKSGAI